MDKPKNPKTAQSNVAAEDEIFQVELTIANGYTGRSSVIISKDSIKFSLDNETKQYELDTLTSKELWESINSACDLNLLSKIKSGYSNQDKDGTDTICSVKTKNKNNYSFTNGYGKEYEEQKKLISILMTQLDKIPHLAVS